ncbi:VOC family protein [Nonomuraea antimicrobica]
MLRGFATISFWTADLEAAAAWYTEFLGIEPYYRKPGYIEFRVGDYQNEFGLIDSRYAPPGATNGPRARSCTGTWTTWRPPWRSCSVWAPRSTSRSPTRETERGSSRRRWSTRSGTSSGSCATRTT